ncbi:MAG: hypothetical protein AB1714_23720 [Acidobacteriota bacterium]
MKKITGPNDVNQVPSYASEKAPPESPQKVAGGYYSSGSTGVQRAGDVTGGSPNDLPVDDLVHVLKDLGLGLLSRDLVRNPDPPLPKDLKRNPG